MGQADKEREILVCQLVADEINKSEGTDYRAIPCNSDPPDVLLVSSSGKHMVREAEVVSTPQDFTIRYDNKNVKQFERNLRRALDNLRFCHGRVSVHWSESAIRFGVKEELISALADIIAATAPTVGNLHLRGVEIYQYSPELSRIAHYVSISRLPYPALEVHSSFSWWAPQDGRWIEEAVAKKISKYRCGSVSRKLLLIVDGGAYLDGDQLTAFRVNNRPEQIPFAQLWIVTMGRAFHV